MVAYFSMLSQFIFYHMASAVQKSKSFHISNGAIWNNDEYLKESQHRYEGTIPFSKNLKQTHCWAHLVQNTIQSLQYRRKKTNRLLQVNLELFFYPWTKQNKIYKHFSKSKTKNINLISIVLNKISNSFQRDTEKKQANRNEC